MRMLTFQTASIVLIAVSTTLATTAFTWYLLNRPWCIQLDSDTDQRILYGSNHCSPDAADSPQRLIAQEKDFDLDVYSKYQ